MKLSLIIPTYNRAPLLRETLASVLAQTRRPDEIIVIDDGSSDNTAAVVAEFAPARYYRQANAGLAAARTTGLRQSEGDLLCFLDSDDLLRPEALAALEKALAAQPSAALAYCRSQTIGAEGALLEPLWGKEDHEGQVWERLIEGNFIRSSGCALVRRTHLEKVDLWDADLPAIEDWDLWVRLAETGPFVRVDEPLFQYRIHPSNMSRDVYRMHCQTFRLLRKHMERNRNHPGRLSCLRAAGRRAREIVYNECLHFADEARRQGDRSRALLNLRRAVGMRPRCLFERRFRRGVIAVLPLLGRAGGGSGIS